MSDLIQKITEEGLVDFLLNPYKRTACIDKSILQKYPRDFKTDDLAILRLGSRNCWRYGCIDYENKQIFIEKAYLLRNNITGDKPFLSLYDFRSDLKESLKKELDEMKTSRLKELDEMVTYSILRAECKTNHFEKILFSILGADAYHPPIRVFKNNIVSMIVDEVNLDDMVNYMSGHRKFIDEELDKIFKSDTFLISEIIIPNLTEEAKKAIETGNLTKRQKNFKNYIEKTKASGAQRFTVETERGEKLSCQNRVSPDGSLTVVGRFMKYVDFEEVSKVTYRNKVIYC